MPRLRFLVATAVLAAGSLAQAAPPSHFGDVLGNGLLCRDQTSNRYYFDYLSQYFGRPYKREGGAYWFRTDDAMLWGVPVLQVIVSDESYPYSFVGAVTDTTPEELEKAILRQDGLAYAKIDTSRYPVRESKPGSRIVYFNTRSKIYCAKFKQLPPALR
jgi:hypothetical protein